MYVLAIGAVIYHLDLILSLSNNIHTFMYIYYRTDYNAAAIVDRLNATPVEGAFNALYYVRGCPGCAFTGKNGNHRIYIYINIIYIYYIL